MPQLIVPQTPAHQYPNQCSALWMQVEIPTGMAVLMLLSFTLITTLTAILGLKFAKNNGLIYWLRSLSHFITITNNLNFKCNTLLECDIPFTSYKLVLKQPLLPNSYLISNDDDPDELPKLFIGFASFFHDKKAMLSNLDEKEVYEDDTFNINDYKLIPKEHLCYGVM